jgi:hypothetical protein
VDLDEKHQETRQPVDITMDNFGQPSMASKINIRPGIGNVAEF